MYIICVPSRSSKKSSSSLPRIKPGPFASPLLALCPFYLQASRVLDERSNLSTGDAGVNAGELGLSAALSPRDNTHNFAASNQRTAAVALASVLLAVRVASTDHVGCDGMDFGVVFLAGVVVVDGDVDCLEGCSVVGFIRSNSSPAGDNRVRANGGLNVGQRNCLDTCTKIDGRADFKNSSIIVHITLLVLRVFNGPGDIVVGAFTLGGATNSNV